ncbi:MAG: MFS transporter [Gammaproteobacteria bacterium]
MIRPILPLLVAAAILLGGNGMLGTLVALRGRLEGFDTDLIGLMGACYFLGFFIASFNSARLIRSIGHVRAFAALAAVGATIPLVMAMVPNAWVWMLVRIMSGFCFSGLLMVVESWINEMSKNADRGRVLGIYRIVDLVSVTCSQFLIPTVGEAGFEIFSIVSLMYCLSLVPVAISNRSRPKVPEKFKLSLSSVWAISPLACLTTLAIGLTNSAFRLVGPLYGVEIGLATSSVVIFMTMGIIGGALSQYPLGHMSDKLGRRKTVLISTAGAMLAAFYLSRLHGGSELTVFIGAFMFGAFAMPLNSLAAAHANDRAGLGAVVGPYTASLVIHYFGPSAFFVYTCAVHGTLALVVMIRIKSRASVPAEQRSKFVSLLRTSPAFLYMARRISRDKSKPKPDPVQPADDDA